MKTNQKILFVFLSVILLVMSNIALALPTGERPIKISPSKTVIEQENTCPNGCTCQGDTVTCPVEPVCQSPCVKSGDTCSCPITIYKNTTPLCRTGNESWCSSYKPGSTALEIETKICKQGCICKGETTTCPIESSCKSPCFKSGDTCSCPAEKEKTCPLNCICEGGTVACPTLQEKSIDVEISSSKGVSTLSIAKVSEESISIKEGASVATTTNKLVIEDKKLLMETSQGNKEIKVMPSSASETAITQLKLKNYEIELKDVGKPIYEVTGTKEVKIMGLFKTKMSIKSQINAETGSVEKTEKPWWSFLAKE